MAPQTPAINPTGVGLSIRFYRAGIATANFEDSEWYFTHITTGDQAYSQGLRLSATVADLEFSFDGTNVHGKITAGTSAIYYNRREGGIYLRGAASVYVVEAW